MTQRHFLQSKKLKKDENDKTGWNRISAVAQMHIQYVAKNNHNV